MGNEEAKNEKLWGKKKYYLYYTSQPNSGYVLYNFDKFQYQHIVCCKVLKRVWIKLTDLAITLNLKLMEMYIPEYITRKITSTSYLDRSIDPN